MKQWLFLPIVVLLLSAACQGAERPTPDAVISPTLVARTLAATPTARPTATSPLPSPTPTPSLTMTPSPTFTATPSPTLTSPPTSTSSPEPTRTPSPTPSASPTLTPERIPQLSAAQPGTVENFELIGHDPIGSIGWHGGLALQDGCAYVGNYSNPAVSIVDISDPADPVQLDGLSLSPGARPVELRTVPGLNLLVVADLGLSQLLTFDVTDCTQPTPLGVLDLPGPPHEFFLRHSGSRTLAYAAMFDHTPPDLVVVDLTEPSTPKEVARWSAADEGAPGILHSLSISPDGSTAYLAMWRGGFLILEVDLPRLAAKRDAGGDFEPAAFLNTHSAVPLRDPQFILLASEVFDCPFAGLAVADIANPARPEIVSRFTLPENRCDDLPRPDGVFSVHNPLVVDHLVLASWYAAGVQAIDLRDPYAPQRVGQFVPSGEGIAARGLLGSYPVQMFSYPILRDGLLYVTDSRNGLYVLRYTGPGAEALAIPWAEGNVIAVP